MSNEVVKQSKVMELSQYLEARKSALAAVLPKYLTPERLSKIACAAVSRTPKLMQCTIPSLYMAVTQAAQLGLEPSLQGSCYLVPFGNQATLIVGYRGLIDLCRRSGGVLKVEARIVYENDMFDYNYGIKPTLSHDPGPVTNRGAMVSVYAIAWLSETMTQFEVMGADEVNKVRNSSRAGNSGPWVDWTEEMWKKTAVRRLAKYLPMAVEMRQAMSIEDAAEAGKAPIVGLPGEEIFEADLVPHEEEPSETQKSVQEKVLKKVGKKPAKKEEPVPDGVFSLIITGETENYIKALADMKLIYEPDFNHFIRRGLDYGEVKRTIEFMADQKWEDLSWAVVSEATGEAITVEPY